MRSNITDFPFFLAEVSFLLRLYCNTVAGNRTSQALLGLQLPPDQQQGFDQVIQKLEADFTFTTLPEDARRVFDMFIQ